MKNKKKTIIITSIVIVLTIAAYFIYSYFSDEDIDKISKKVTIASYESIFLKQVEKQFGKSFNQLTDQEKYNVIEKMSADKNPVIRIVSIRYLSKLSDKEKAISLLSPLFSDDSPEVVEEAIFSLKTYPKEKSVVILKNFITSCYEQPDINEPFSNILRLGMVGSDEKNGLSFQMQESQQNQLDLSDGNVYEINLLIPKGFDIMFSFPNFDDNWETFSDSKLIKKFSKLEAYEDFKRLSFVSDYFRIKKMVEDKVGFLSKFFEPGKLFRDDLKVAKYGSDILFVTFKGRNLEILTNLVNILKGNSGLKFSVAEEKYNDTKIISLVNRTGQRQINYAEISEYFILSNSSELIKRSIESFQVDNTKSVTFDPNFQKEYNKLDLTGKKNFVFAYFQPTKISGFEAINKYSAYLAKIALNVFNDINEGKADLTGLFGKNYPSKDLDDNIIKFVPNDVISFYYTRNANLYGIWNYFINVKANLPEEITNFERLSNVNFENEILGKLGSQLFVCYSGVNYKNNETENSSSLKLSLGIRLKNLEGINKNLQKLFEYLFEKKVERRFYQGVEIFTSGPTSIDAINNQVIENFVAPSFSLVGNYVLLGTNSKLINDLIDSYKGIKPSSQLLNSSLSEIDDKMFIDGNLLLEDYYKYLMKYSSKSTSISTFETEGKVKPLFDILKLIKKIEFLKKKNDFFYDASASIVVN
jgi:hypothetical protein